MHDTLFPQQHSGKSHRTCLWSVCVLKACVTFNILPTLKSNTRPTIACKNAARAVYYCISRTVNRKSQTCQRVLGGRDCAQRVSTNRTCNNNARVLLVQTDALGTIIFSKPSNPVVNSQPCSCVVMWRQDAWKIHYQSQTLTLSTCSVVPDLLKFFFNQQIQLHFLSLFLFLTFRLCLLYISLSLPLSQCTGSVFSPPVRSYSIN